MVIFVNDLDEIIQVFIWEETVFIEGLCGGER